MWWESKWWIYFFQGEVSRSGAAWESATVGQLVESVSFVFFFNENQLTDEEGEESRSFAGTVDF